MVDSVYSAVQSVTLLFVFNRLMRAALIVKCQDSLLFDVFAADEYGHWVSESILFVALFVRATGVVLHARVLCTGLYGGSLYTSGVHT